MNQNIRPGVMIRLEQSLAVWLGVFGLVVVFLWMGEWWQRIERATQGARFMILHGRYLPTPSGCNKRKGCVSLEHVMNYE